MAPWGVRETRMQSCTIRWGLCLVLLSALGGVGCSSARGREGAPERDLARSVLSGFEPAPSRLFVAESRLGMLLDRLGYDANLYAYDCDHPSDGTALRCWNRDRTQAVLIRKGQPPRLVTTPPGAFLDDQDHVVAWRSGFGRTECDAKVSLRGGRTIFAPNFRMDADGHYFVYGGDYYDYQANARRTCPIRWARVDRPEGDPVTTGLTGSAAGVFAAGKTLYIVARDDDRLRCEAYEQDGPTVSRIRSFDLHPPATWAVAWVVPADFDAASRTFLIKVGRDLPPLGGPLWYLYDLSGNRFRKVGVFEGYAGFLDRHLFDRSLEESAAVGASGRVLLEGLER